MKAVILLSGGLDSTTCLAIAKAEGFDCYALSFNYSQKHAAELTAARKIASHFQVKSHRIVDLPAEQFSGSALVDPLVAVPDFHLSHEIPSTYVPARNTIFLAIALGWAEILRAQHIYIGASAIDYSNYPDCRPEFIAAFEQVANLATKISVEGQVLKIHAPLIQLSKAQTILLGKNLGVDYRLTVSCYRVDSEGLACGLCDSCMLRKKGFKEAELPDETVYALKK